MLNAFAGVVALSGAPVPRGVSEVMARTIARRTGRRVVLSGGAQAVFAGGVGRTGPDGALFVCDARLHNSDELAGGMGLSGHADDADVVCRSFEKDGDEGIARLLGAFAFAHWDERARKLTLARDYGAARPLFFHRGREFLFFASYLPDLLALPGVPRELDERMIASLLALNHCEPRNTYYRDIARVPPRMVLRFSAEGLDARYYWTPDLSAPAPPGSDADLVAQGRALFDIAVARTIRDLPNVAVMTSGGLDSSAVAATAARLGTASSVTCYTALPPEGFGVVPPRGRYASERNKVEALGRLHPGLRQRFITPRGPHPDQSDPARLFLRAGIPVRNVANLGWLGRVQDAIAADGHATVLTGQMGNLSLTSDGALLLSELARSGRIALLLREARASARHMHVGVLRILVGEALLPFLPRSANRLIGRLRGRSPYDVSRYSLLRPEAIAALDLERQWAEEGFDASFRRSGTAAEVRAAGLFDRNQSIRDLVSMAPSVHGLEMRDPFADRELIAFCLALPETLYRRNAVPRWFARQVFADRLPSEILHERQRGLQAPNWFEMLDARRDSIAAEVERLEGSALASRLIDLPRLKALVAHWPRNAEEAETRMADYRLALDRAVHVGRFVRWVEGGNA